MRDPRRPRSLLRGLPCAGLLLALAAAAVPAWATRPVPAGVDPQQVTVAAEAILCDCGCHPQSVHDCACGRAEEMWSELAAEVAGGGPGGAPLTGEQVIAKWVAARGEKILVAPPAAGFNLVAWLGPLALLVGAAVALVAVLRRWAARAPLADAAGPSGAAPEPPAVDPAYLERIRRDLEERG